MLHLKFALNLENLADELIQVVKSAWKSPFESPIVIFPDPKLEQWFRLYWVQKCGTLANFNSMMIDRFLMMILCPNDNSKKKLNADLLRNVIWAYLYNKDEKGERNYRGLGAEVTRYLETEGVLDEQHLFDLCGKMASLFLEYETSRPAGFIRKGGNLSADGGLAEGILDRWQQGNLRDFFDGSEREIWQRQLYSQIFHEQNGEPSILTKAFDAANQRMNQGKEHPIETTYLTIPFLFRDCLASQGKFYTEQFSDMNGDPLPVFIFGLTGMGQFYRVILQKFAEANEVFAYIQNPCMEFWEDIDTAHSMKNLEWSSRKGYWHSNKGDVPQEVHQKLSIKLNQGSSDEVDGDFEDGVNCDNENTLLCYWGKSGRDNIKLWCQTSDYDFEFDGAVNAENLPKDTLLHKIQYMVANRRNELPELLEGADNSFTLSGAPTKEREMELLHTRICKLLAERDAHGNPVNRISDILVVSPDIDSYRTAIFQTFDQESGNGLHIPFSIVDSPAKTSLTAEALNALFAIQEEGSIFRTAFFDLIRNPVVQQARHITDEDVIAWQGWIENTNTFRFRGNHDDWKQVLQRLLAAKFSSLPVDDETADYGSHVPYNDMMSSDQNSLCKFADCITELENWIQLVKTYPSVREDMLDGLATLINKWIAMTNIPEGFGGEAVIYQNTSAALENLRFQFYAGAKTISWKCISQTLIDAAQSTQYSSGSLFVNGITFARFIPNRIIPIKHLFFIGADSANFPGAKNQNTLDLRKTVTPWPGDDSPIAKKRYAFLCQLMSTKESFHISYMNQNIVKDEELYPTSIVNDLRNFFKNAVISTYSKRNTPISATEAKNLVQQLWPEEKMPLDETRAYSELFSAKELRNKSIYKNLMFSTGTDEKTQLPESGVSGLPERVSISQITKFLKDPFQFQVDRNIISEDENINVFNENFEPIDIDCLEQSNLLKTLVLKNFAGDIEGSNKLYLKMQQIKDLPDGVYGDKLWEVIKEKGETIIQQMEADLDSPYLNVDDWIFDAQIEVPITQPDGYQWILSGSTSWCNKEKTRIALLTTSSPKGSGENPDFDIGKFLGGYVTALAFIAEKKTEVPVMVSINIYCSHEGVQKPATRVVHMDSMEAVSILQRIYQKAFVDRFSKAMPVEMLWEEISDFEHYHGGILKNWKFFDKKNLFDIRKDCGFDQKKDFTEFGVWYIEAKEQKSLIQLSTIEELESGEEAE